MTNQGSVLVFWVFACACSSWRPASASRAAFLSLARSTRSARSARHRMPYFQSTRTSGAKQQLRSERKVKDQPAPSLLMSGSMKETPAAPRRHRERLLAAVAEALWPG